MDRLAENAAGRLAQFRAQTQVVEFEHGGARWVYRRGGKGKPLLFLPGGEFLAEAGFEWLLAFQRDFTVIAPSYPVGLTGLAPMVDGIAHLIEMEGLEQAYVLGTSLGGMVAQLLVRACPGRIASLVLSQTCAPDPRYGSRLRSRIRWIAAFPAKALRWLLIASLDRSTRNEPEADFWKTYLRQLYAEPPGLAKAILLSSYRAISDFCLSYRFSPDDLSGWPGRILITTAGEDDRLSAEGQRQLIDLYPNAGVHTFPNAKHMLGSKYREAYVQVVITFITSE